MAYADDITIFLTRPEEIPKLQEILNTYQKASGVRINMDKSRAMAIGEWDECTLVWGNNNTGIHIQE